MKIKDFIISIKKPSDFVLSVKQKQMYEESKKEKAKNPPDNSTTPKRTRSEQTREFTLRNLAEYNNIGVKKYRVSTCGDQRVCHECKKHDNKVYKVKDAVIGVNAPPFCDNCRCLIMAEFEF